MDQRCYLCSLEPGQTGQKSVNSAAALLLLIVGVIDKLLRNALSHDEPTLDHSLLAEVVAAGVGVTVACRHLLELYLWVAFALLHELLVSTVIGQVLYFILSPVERDCGGLDARGVEGLQVGGAVEQKCSLESGGQLLEDLEPKGRTHRKPYQNELLMIFLCKRDTGLDSLQNLAEFEPPDGVELVVEERLRSEGHEEIGHDEGYLVADEELGSLHNVEHQAQVLVDDDAGVGGVLNDAAVGVEVGGDALNILPELGLRHYYNQQD